MFEPENDIERMLLRAAEPAERSSFVRALMDTEIFLVRIPEGGKVTRGPDGHAVIPAGVKLIMPTVTRGEENLVPFFSAPSRARAWFPGDHLIAPELTRCLFSRYPNTSFVLNPNSDCGKYFTPVEVRRLLAGQFEEGVHTVNTEGGEEILLAYPRETPGSLIAALGRELGAVNSVRGAWLMVASLATEPELSWMLGVEHNGSWQDVQLAIDRAVAGDVLDGRTLNVMKLDDSSVSATLRTGISVIQATRVLL